MKSINERWEEFAKATLHAEAPEVQRTEMKRAFFGGWLSSLGVLNCEIAGMPDEAVEAQLDKFIGELNAYHEAMKQ